MSVQYYGYSRMPTNLHETFPFLDLEQSKQQLKQYTSVYIPRTTENNRFKFTGREIKEDTRVPRATLNLGLFFIAYFCSFHNPNVNIKSI